MGWFETKEEKRHRQPPGAMPIGPSLIPTQKGQGEGDDSPVMTFRAPGATPVTIHDPKSESRAKKVSAPVKSEPAPLPKKRSASKVGIIVAGFAVLAAVGVAVGWFISK